MRRGLSGLWQQWRENIVGFQRVVAEIVQLAGEILSRISESEVVLMWRRFSSKVFYATRERWSDCRCGQA